MSGKASRYVLYVGATMSLLILSGCAPWEWIKEKLGFEKKSEAPIVQVEAGKIQPVELRSRRDKVLVTMENIPIMTLESFKEEEEKILEENPQLQSMKQFIPDFDFNVLNGLISQLVMDRYIQEKGLDQKSEYKKDFERLMISIKRVLNRKYFTQEHPVSVTDSEVKKFYEENKDKIPGLIVSSGGIRAAGIKFDKEDTAKTFFDTVKGKSKEFDDIAKKEGLGDKIQDFKLVNEQSIAINATLRSKITALKRFPIVEIFKISDKEFWVVNATSKEEKQYRSFDDVKEFLKNDLEREKEMKSMEAAIDKLKGEYKVIIDEEAAKILRPTPPEEQKAAKGFDVPEEVKAPLPATATKTV